MWGVMAHEHGTDPRPPPSNRSPASPPTHSSLTTPLHRRRLGRRFRGHGGLNSSSSTAHSLTRPPAPRTPLVWSNDLHTRRATRPNANCGSKQSTHNRRQIPTPRRRCAGGPPARPVLHTSVPLLQSARRCTRSASTPTGEQQQKDHQPKIPRNGRLTPGESRYSVTAKTTGRRRVPGRIDVGLHAGGILVSNYH